MPPVSQSSLTVPGGDTRVVYRLVASRGGQETSLSVAIAVTCPTPWFFPNAPAALGCPAGPASSTAGAYQPFERGWMIRLQLGSGQDRVCGIQNDRQRYSCFAFVPYTGTPAVTPPAGLFPPGADFQEVFYDKLAIGGFWYDIIGWGTTSVSNAPLTTQRDSQGRIYVQTPLGIYRFDSGLTNGPVERIG